MTLIGNTFSYLSTNIQIIRLAIKDTPGYRFVLTPNDAAIIDVKYVYAMYRHDLRLFQKWK